LQCQIFVGILYTLPDIGGILQTLPDVYRDISNIAGYRSGYFFHVQISVGIVHTLPDIGRGTFCNARYPSGYFIYTLSDIGGDTSLDARYPSEYFTHCQISVGILLAMPDIRRDTSYIARYR
jgi:hypothetical protein